VRSAKIKEHSRQLYFWFGTRLSIMSMLVASVAYCSCASCASVMLMAACTAGCSSGTPSTSSVKVPSTAGSLSTFTTEVMKYCAALWFV